jgi:uncharacterized protein (DUF697 family)
VTKTGLGAASDIMKTGRDLARRQSLEVRVVGLVQDPDDRLVLASLLAAHTENGDAVVRALGKDSVGDVADADLALVVVRDTQTAGASGFVSSVAERRAHTIVIVPSCPEASPDSVAALLGVKAAHLVCAPGPDVLPEQAIEKAVKIVGDRRIALCAAFPAFREAGAREVVTSTAWQNAAVATVLAVPGADLPVLTANQIKMVLRIAAIHGETIGMERAKEILLVVGGGLTFRTIAREALDFLPGPGWLIKGAFAYGGTVAIGKAAGRYFALGPDGRSKLVAKLREKSAKRRLSRREPLTEPPAQPPAQPLTGPPAQPLTRPPAQPPAQLKD